ncbi:VWA domain-containing protein [Thermodesulfobacteriota bacterium]
MKPRRRPIEIFSLSFLDCICCAFGAIILLFVLSKFAEPVVIENLQIDLKAEIVRLERDLAEIRGKTIVFNRDLKTKKQQLSKDEEKLARLQGDLSAIKGQFEAKEGRSAVQNIIEGKLAKARQELTREMKRLLKGKPVRVKRSVGGIPVDSEFIIFIIDTSGSMRRNAWGLVQKKMKEVLEVYPRVKGIQVMNDMGEYMFSQYRGKWIPDTPARRRAIIVRLAGWRAFSNSSPVEGITAAIHRFYSRDKKISLYIFGDEFSGEAIQPVVDKVDRLNRSDQGGSRRVRIHAVGFPVVMEKTDHPGNTGERFAMLMRILCHRNGGTFVGLNRTRP